MPLELLVILIVLGTLAIAGAAIYAIRRTQPALPAAPEAKSLPEADRPGDAGAKPPGPPGPPHEQAPAPVAKVQVPVDPAQAAEHQRYVQGLARTRGGFVARLAALFRGKPRVSSELKEEVEEVLFTADIGAKTAQKLLDQVTALLDRTQVADPAQVWAVIRREARAILTQPQQSLPAASPGPYVLLVIGVNGVGKTTTLGKLAALHQAAGRKVLLVAGDTFRAAAGEQLEIWAQRVGCEIHQGKHNADPSAVIFEGILRGHREGFDAILCDTAGRLHTKKELMDELQKIRRSCAKAIAKATNTSDDSIHGPQDTFLVLDATIGQNALAQAALFKETMDFTGLVLTKLDGTAKGGVVLGVVDEMQVPVRYIGIGEAIDDLRTFNPDAFCDALFDHDQDHPPGLNRSA